jgi:hypothetical protein
VRVLAVAAAAALLGFGPGARAQGPALQALPELLQLQPGQEAAWRAYADAEAQGRAEATHQQAEATALNDLPTPARLDAVAAAMRQDEAAFERHAAATKAFYAVLSPEQRGLFDRLTRLPAAPSPMRASDRPRGLIPSGSRLRLPDADDLPAPTR